MIAQRFKTLIRNGFKKAGFEVRKIRNESEPDVEGSNWVETGNEWDIEAILNLSLKPGCVIDAGVAGGTPSLYKAFPEAPLLLIEPMKYFNPTIESRMKTFPNQYLLVNSAVGEEVGEINFHFNENAPLQSMVVASNGEDNIQMLSVPIDTIDNIVERMDCVKPYVLKIDVEGHELEALRGADKCLNDCDAVIIEVGITIWGGYKNRTLQKIDQLLHDKGFSLYTLLDAQGVGPRHYRHVRKADFVYVKK